MPLKELERLQAVNRFLTLEIDRKKELDDIVKMAAEICQTPVALITMLDDQTQFIKFSIGFERDQTRQEDAFCQYAIQSYDLLEVADATKDARFVNNPLVTDDPNIRFYAGSPLTTQDGHNLGSLCVIDQYPRILTTVQKQVLVILSRQVTQILEFELSIKIMKDQFIQARQAEIKLRSFFESSVSCHLLLGMNFDVMAYNKSLKNFIKDVFGISVKLDMDIRNYVHSSHQQTFVNNYQAALVGNTIISEREIAYADKMIYWYIIYEPARNPEGDIIGVSLNATDITKRISQERLVFAQNESLRKIAFIQSHELRRPVSSILGLMELIKEQDYYQGSEELVMLGKATNELDDKIRDIVNHTI